ncbi:MAG: [LysW]-aminoadipate kinase, partial [Chloroflexota bacterium]
MIVVKVGGGKGIDLEAFCRDLASVIKARGDVVLVHGGSHETNVLSERLGKPPRFVTSISGVESRYTDRETLEIFTMVYIGKVNKYIVEQLQRHGVNAVGLSGIDGRLLEGSRKPFIKVIEDGKRKVLRDDYTGKVERVNVDLVRLLHDNGYTLVVAPPAISYESESINVDGDRAAAVLAAALNAEKLVILSNVPGLLRDVSDEASLIREIPRNQIERFADYAKGRMKKKVMGAAEALDAGVRQVVFADARIDNAVQQALEG